MISAISTKRRADERDVERDGDVGGDRAEGGDQAHGRWAKRPDTKKAGSLDGSRPILT